MAQTKKIEVKQAILDAAASIISERGYSNASVSAIAKLANVSPANVYVYFPSKLDILFAIYDPWLTRQFDKLERTVERISDPSQRLKKILSMLWRDIPSADNGFANTMMQALSTATAREGYKPTLRFTAEARLTRLLEECLPSLSRDDVRDLASVLFMAFDGYIVNFHLAERATCPPRHLVLLADILLAYENKKCASGSPRRRPGRAQRRRDTKTVVLPTLTSSDA